MTRGDRKQKQFETPTVVDTSSKLVGRPSQERCGLSCVSPSASTIRLSSGRERAFIFRMRLVRCTFTVDFSDADVVRNLFVEAPAVAWIMISRSRGLSVSKRCLSAPKALSDSPVGHDRARARS